MNTFPLTKCLPDRRKWVQLKIRITEKTESAMAGGVDVDMLVRGAKYKSYYSLDVLDHLFTIFR